jgi:hypothetical protein
MATKKTSTSESTVEHFEVTYDDLAGHRRVQQASSEDDAIEAAEAFALENMSDVQVHKVTTTHAPIAFKAPVKKEENDGE